MIDEFLIIFCVNLLRSQEVVIQNQLRPFYTYVVFKGEHK